MSFTSDDALKLFTSINETNKGQQTQIQELVKLMQVAISGPKKPGDNKWDRIENFVKAINLFSGKEEEWQEFSGKFKRCIKQGSREVHELLIWVEDNLTEEEVAADDYEKRISDSEFDLDFEIDNVPKWVSEVSARIYSLLVLLTKGDANAVVCRVRRDNGLAAWRKLCNISSPKTLATAVVAMRNVQNPGKINDAMKVESAIDDWEDKITKLENDFGEKLSFPMRIATLYGMVPKEMQDRLLDKCQINWTKRSETEAKNEYSILKQEMKNYSRARKNDRVPMDCSAVTSGDWHECATYPEEAGAGHADQAFAADGYWAESEYDINYIGKGKGKGKGYDTRECFACGMPGHIARNCRSSVKGQGKGKGTFGGFANKGGGKGTGQGGQYFGSAGSRPDTRTCFGCGEVGHPVARCPKFKKDVNGMEVQDLMGVIAADIEEEQQQYDGGIQICHIGQIKAEGAEKKRKKMRRFISPKLKEQNKKLFEPTDLKWKDDHLVVVLAEKDVESLEIKDIMPIGAKPQNQFVSVGFGEITVDSAAEESVAPKEWGSVFEVKQATKQMIFRAANGKEMKHDGEMDVNFRENDGQMLQMKFQVTEVKKALAAVWRIAEKGNYVRFGPKEEDCFIQNIETNKKIWMTRKGGSYVLKVEFMVKLAKPVFTGHA